MSDPKTGKEISVEKAEIDASTLKPVFKLVFLTVLGLTVLALLINIAMVVAYTKPSDQVKSLIDTCSTIVKAGFGAIVGLIGGKAI